MLSLPLSPPRCTAYAQSRANLLLMKALVLRTGMEKEVTANRPPSGDHDKNVLHCYINPGSLFGRGGGGGYPGRGLASGSGRETTESRGGRPFPIVNSFVYILNHYRNQKPKI